MPDPQILMPNLMMDYVMDRLDAAFVVHKSWEPGGTIDHGEIRAIAVGPHAEINAALIDALPKLEIIANFGVGYDNVDAGHAAGRGVIVTNTPDVLTQEVADTAMGLLLMTARQLGAAERFLRAGKWQDPFPLSPATLRGRTLGIIGLGRIGKAIATRARSFGMSVSYTGRHRQSGVDYQYHPSTLALAEAVDTLMVVVPGGEA
ncbi:MAG: NAD(P)-dependent oxidoreductase, partial [Alphaproteobacteria bacterium]